MPLPDNQPISVRPNTSEDKHKHAITLRMSEDLIEALMANPQNLSFEFGPTSKNIYVNDQVFGLTMTKEQSPNELFMHMPLHRDKTFKHYADISARFTVSAGSLDEAAKKLRTATDEANKQRQERKIVMLEEPPTTSMTTAKKTKAPARKAAASSSTALARPSSTQHAPPAAPSRPLSAINPDLRYRVVHCLASHNRTPDELVKRVCGHSADESKKNDVHAIMRHVGEAKEGLWQLSSKGWLEVQPFKWSHWSDTDRQLILQKVTAAFKLHKIPEGDPRWENLAQPKPAPVLPPTPAAASKPSVASSSRHPLPAKPSPPEPPKRPTGTKDKKPRAKPETKGTSAKDDRHLAPTASGHAGGVRSKEPPKSLAALPVEPPRPARVEALATTTRKQPGSGYKAPRTLTPPARTLAASDSRASSDELPSVKESARASTSKGPSAARSGAEQSRVASSSTPTPQPQPRERDRVASSAQASRARADSKERPHPSSNTVRAKAVEVKKPVDEARRHALKREEEETPPKKSVKRKAPARDNSYDSSSDDDRVRNSKRRKAGDGAARPSATVKKADPVKVKRSDSPPPPPPRSKNPERDALAGLGRIPKSKGRASPMPAAAPRLTSANSGSSGSSQGHKRRRASTPQYTSSSEDEDEPRPIKKKAAPSGAVPRPSAGSSASSTPRPSATPRPSTTKARKSRPVTIDTVQEEYQHKFLEYMPVALADRKQRVIVERLLDARSDESADEDGLLSEGEGQNLHAKHLRLRGELLDLEKQFMRLAPAAA